MSAIEQQRGAGVGTAAEGILGAIGSTPLVRLERYLQTGPGPELYLKLEQANPGGSVKDRPATAMIETALAAGDLHRGGTVIESSSGNMGVGLAQACRYHGLRLICVVDSRASAEKVATMRAFGAEVRVVREPDPISGDLLSARIALVARLCTEIPGAFWPDQYENASNPRSHAEGTMREVYEALGRELDYLFVPASTTGTLIGCEQYLRARGATTELVAVDAEGSALFGGDRAPRRLPGLGAGVETGISRQLGEARVVRVSDLDCVIGCRRLIAREAIFGGASTGGVLTAVSRVAPELPAGCRVAVIAPDSGVGYLRTVYDDTWVQRELGLSAAGIERLVATDRPAEAPTAAA